VGRDINRQRFSASEIADGLQKPVVKDLLSLIHLRNTCAAFDGAFELLPSSDGTLHLLWTNADSRAELFVDFSDLGYKLAVTDKHHDGMRDFRFSHTLS
jgi:sucrose phosphorylase